MDLQYDSSLGRGAFGQVWRAMDRLGRAVAVKFFSDTNPSQMEKNAHDHALALARVRHPAVVQILSLETQPHPDSGAPLLALIMEYVPGGSLSLHKGALPVEHAVGIVTDLVGALEAIHAAHLVHGDLHDGNVMLTATGAKLIDLLYTHSLAEVGTKTAARTRQEDLRDLAKVFRQVVAKGGLEGDDLAEAYYRAGASLSNASEVGEPFLRLLGPRGAAKPTLGAKLAAIGHSNAAAPRDEPARGAPSASSSTTSSAADRPRDRTSTNLTVAFSRQRIYKDDKNYAYRHDYACVVHFANHGLVPITVWTIEVEFPAMLLRPGITAGTDVRDRVSRRLSHMERSAPIQAGESVEFVVVYMMTDDIRRMRGTLFQEQFLVRAWVDGQVVDEQRVPVEKTQDF